MANFLTINKVSGRLKFIVSNRNVSTVAKSGAPLYLSLRDPFLEAAVPLHLQVQVNVLPKEKTMHPNKIARMAFLLFEEFKVHTGLANDPTHELTAALGVFISGGQGKRGAPQTHKLLIGGP